MTTQLTSTLNGLDPDVLKELADTVAADASQGKMAFRVSTTWVEGGRSIARVKSFDLGNETIERDFHLVIDEPEEAGGTNLGPNPQEVILAALNACLMTTFTVLCTLEGIRLEKVDIQSSGQLDLRGFFGLDANVTPGFQALDWTLTVRGDATEAQFQKIYETAIAVSPNVWNLRNPVAATPRLQVES
ncbi:OsmC family protein [Romeria aff. gracilis LEGE 07310]|uniref:OsmC family protein n=1 Tax=Vasconcelosia minhoensis LEGE 07310 TaxID=915328 RepID=A0A8J7AVW8_9CYAN|nr:OsmC family protein [Romeria gracilis]MBE9078018.1 OsmC family protein [Romeria aff. gracilis LEGE 07310]